MSRPRPQPITPGPGQESVWDYPRPPRLEHSPKHIEVVFAGVTVADSRNTVRVCETSGPPVYYVPPGDVRTDLLIPSAFASFCEWKGNASYFSIRAGGREAKDAAFSYATPTTAFAAIQRYVAFYAGRVDACYVDGEEVTPQAGPFYAGWITGDVVGPFKGDPGTEGW